MRRLIRTSVVIGCLAMACGIDARVPPAPPGDVVPGLTPGPERHLSAKEVASDAFEPDGLLALLEEAGLVGAVERSYSGGRAEIRRVRVRIVTFASVRGANRFLAWLKAHDDQLIGSNEVVASLAVPTEALVRLHEPDGCCPMETPVSLTTWRTGTYVVVLSASGPGVDASLSTAVAMDVHDAITDGS